MTQVSQERLKLETTIRGGSGWFFWTACLSLVNSATLLTGGDWGFLVGLGATELVSALAHIIADDLNTQAATIVRVIGFCVDLGIAGVFLLFGYLARRKSRIAYLLGILLYLLDIIIVLYIKDYPSAAFHLFALLFLCGGLIALNKLVRLENETPTLV